MVRGLTYFRLPTVVDCNLLVDRAGTLAVLAAFLGRGSSGRVQAVHRLRQGQVGVVTVLLRLVLSHDVLPETVWLGLFPCRWFKYTQMRHAVQHGEATISNLFWNGLGKRQALGPS
jgi:hypothetical protein